MAKVPNIVKTLPKISIVWVGRTNVTDDRRQTDGRTMTYIANVNATNYRIYTDLKLQNKSILLSQLCLFLFLSVSFIGVARDALDAHALTAQDGENK